MPWPSLVVPTAGTVITVAWESAMVNDALLWLRLLTGNADPPATGYVITSTGPASSAWSKVTGDMLAGGAAVANIGYAPVNRAGDVMSGALTVPYPLTLNKLNDTGNGGAVFFAASSGQRSALVDLLNNQLRVLNAAGPPFYVLTYDLTNGALSVPASVTLGGTDSSTTGRLIASTPTSALGYVMEAVGSEWHVYAAPGAAHALAFNLASGILYVDGQRVWHQGNDGAASGLDADLWRGLRPDQMTVGAATNADLLDNVNSSQFARLDAPGNFTVAPSIGGQTIIHGGNIAAQSVAFASNASTLANFPASTTPAAGRVPISDASGKLDDWITPTAAAPVPSGLIAFIPDASVPAGWAFYTALNGRVLVGAGSASVTNAQTFTVGASYGPDWAHGHTVNVQHAHAISADHNHGATALGVGGTIGGPTAVNGLAAPGGTNLPTDTHGHSHTLDVTGTTDGAHSSGTDNAGSAAQGTSGVVWIPPSHALNAIRKS